VIDLLLARPTVAGQQATLPSYRRGREMHRGMETIQLGFSRPNI
jgi:hypothetical protein